MDPVGIVAIVQARVSSTRLPGKVLSPVLGKPMIVYLIERLERCRSLDGIVLATSGRREDDALAELGARLGLPCVRGPLEDVAGRFAEVLRHRPMAAFVRVNGDSPLLDPALVDRVVDLYGSAEVDLATNVFPRSFPPGQSVEVVRARTFLETLSAMDAGEDREHVTRYFYRNAEKFRIANFGASVPCPAVHMAVDTPADRDRLERCLARLERPHWEYGLDALLALWQETPAGSA